MDFNACSFWITPVRASAGVAAALGGVEQRSLAKSRQEGRNGIVMGGQLQGRPLGRREKVTERLWTEGSR